MPVTATWPTTGDFPQQPLEGTWRRQKNPNNKASFTVDVGAPLERRRSKVKYLTATFDIILTPAQLPTLDSFFDDDCRDGVRGFTFTNPETGVSEVWHWNEPPNVSRMTKGAYQVSCSVRRNY
jgi:hypothetical protein